MSTLRDAILNADDGTKELVDVPEWGVTVEVRSMTGVQRAKFLTASVGDDGKPDFARTYPTLIIQTTFDPETGDRVFEDADRDALNEKSAAATERIAKAALRVSGLAEDSVEAGKGV